MGLANAHMVGGNHYREHTYQHWDWVTDTGIDYLGGCVTKYLDRWRKKNGLQDLAKSMHFLDKLIEMHPILVRSHHIRPNIRYIRFQTETFLQSRNIWNEEQDVFRIISAWFSMDELILAKSLLQSVIDRANSEMNAPDPQPVPATDSNRHALQPTS